MTDINGAKERAKAAVADARPELEEISLDIHSHPELAMKETRASKLIADHLEGHGFAVERGAFDLPTAFRARWGEGPVTIAYLCEYDALPEIGHACGHNLIATTGIGGALGLKAAVSPDEVTLLVLGTPAEEDIGGKVDHDRARRVRGRGRGADGAPGRGRRRGTRRCTEWRAST